jgi:3'(2'), 5'-bisphosphate nucleotidase
MGNDLTLLADIALRAAVMASDEIIKIYDQDFTIEFKDDDSPLTSADKASHKAISSLLGSTGIPVFSEEGKSIPYDVRSSFSEFWLVDPLDGTKEFIKRNGEFTVNIALMRNNIPVLGVIAQPVKEKLWCGIPGYGFFSGKISDGEKILSAPFRESNDRSDTKRVLASRSHRSVETDDFINDLKKESSVEIVNAGSALKFCLLAEGKADVYPRFAPTMEWDTAAGHAILLSVGKNIFTYPSNTVLTYNKPNPVNDWFIAR